MYLAIGQCDSFATAFKLSLMGVVFLCRPHDNNRTTALKPLAALLSATVWGLSIHSPIRSVNLLRTNFQWEDWQFFPVALTLCRCSKVPRLHHELLKSVRLLGRYCRQVRRSVYNSLYRLRVEAGSKQKLAGRKQLNSQPLSQSLPRRTNSLAGEEQSDASSKVLGVFQFLSETSLKDRPRRP